MKCSIPRIILATLLCTHSNRSTSFLCWEHQSWTQCSTQDSWEQSGGSELPPSPAGLSAFYAAHDIAALQAASTCCWITSNFSSSNIPKSFSSRPLPVSSFHSLYYTGTDDFSNPRFSDLYLCSSLPHLTEDLLIPQLAGCVIEIRHLEKKID